MKTIPELAKEHGVKQATMIYAANHGLIPARQSTKGAPWLVDDESDAFKRWLSGHLTNRNRTGRRGKHRLFVDSLK